jgi:osmotically-inducible protein OsmY
MASDAQIRDDVISELAWDPQVPDAEGIGVNVSDGAVTLAGRTPPTPRSWPRPGPPNASTA